MARPGLWSILGAAILEERCLAEMEKLRADVELFAQGLAPSR